MTSGVLAEARLQVVVLGHRAADQRTGGQLRSEPVDRAADGRVGRVLFRDRGDQRVPAARLGWRQRRHARVSRGDPSGHGRVSCRGHDLKRSGSAGPERPLHLLVADVGGVGGRDDLDRRHRGLELRDRDRQADQDREGDDAVAQRLTPQPLAPPLKARRAVLAGMRPRERQLVDPGSEPGQHGRQQRQGRREHEDDGEHNPEAHRAERWRGDEHDRGERDQHRDSGEQDGLAGSVHRHGGGIHRREPVAEERAAEAVHNEQRIVDPQRQREHQREVHRPNRDRHDQRAQVQHPGRGSQPDHREHQWQPGRDQRPERQQQDASVTGQEMTSDFIIAVRLAALKSDHIPAAPVR